MLVKKTRQAKWPEIRGILTFANRQIPGNLRLMLTTVRKQLAQILQDSLKELGGNPLELEQIAKQLEVPKKIEHGHMAFPVFSLAKTLRQAPPQIAQKLAALVLSQGHPFITQVAAVGGYVNFTCTDQYMQDLLAKSVFSSGSAIGFSNRGSGKRVVIDYSSPNVAKPMHVGHMRATMIGQSIRNLATTQGYDVIGLNHLGDWGVQFGKLAWAYQKWGTEYPFATQPFESLYRLYVRFHEEEEKNPELDKAGSLVFRRLEEGDPEIKKLWQLFVDITLKENRQIWDLLGVHHDLVRGESFYNDRLKPTEQLLESAGLLEESDGAMVVQLDDLGMPPCLIRKSDGASLYATRDLASAIYRHDELKADMNLYVVAADQSLHFKQVFAVLQKLGFAWVDQCHHIAFGLVRFKDQKLSTRKGQAIFLKDVLDRAVDLTKEIIEKKNPNLENKSLVATQVGVGAVIFHDLVNDRNKDVDFDWDKVLDFEGDTGPYVQYCQVRCRSLEKKYGKPIAERMSAALTETEERELVRLLMMYADTLSAAWDNFKPNILAQYLLDVCHVFSLFYQKHRILGADAQIETSRMTLVRITQMILQSGLSVLSMQAPEAM